MTKINRTLSFSFQGVDQYFCSSQCLEHFKAHPHLFVGDPQHGLSPKKNKPVVLKQRRIMLKKTINEDFKAVL
jgi:YHS domain-containing protein